MLPMLRWARQFNLKPFAFFLLLALLSTPIYAQASFDWPQWQGPDRNAISKERGLLQTWPEKGHRSCGRRKASAVATLILIEPNREKYLERGRFEQPERTREPAWTHPVIANGKLYVRDQDLLRCYDVKKKQL